MKLKLKRKALYEVSDSNIYDRIIFRASKMGKETEIHALLKTISKHVKSKELLSALYREIQDNNKVPSYSELRSKISGGKPIIRADSGATAPAPASAPTSPASAPPSSANTASGPTAGETEELLKAEMEKLETSANALKRIEKRLKKAQEDLEEERAKHGESTGKVQDLEGKLGSLDPDKLSAFKSEVTKSSAPGRWNQANKRFKNIKLSEKKYTTVRKIVDEALKNGYELDWRVVFLKLKTGMQESASKGPKFKEEALERIEHFIFCRSKTN